MTRCKFTMLGNQCLRDLGHEGMHATDRKLPNEDQATIPTPECPDCAQAEQRGRQEERKRFREVIDKTDEMLGRAKRFFMADDSFDDAMDKLVNARIHLRAFAALILEEPKV